MHSIDNLSMLKGDYNNINNCIMQHLLAAKKYVK